MTDMKVRYLGFELKNPLIAASCGLTSSLKGAQKAIEAGAGAIVLKSLFEEQIKADLSPIESSLDSGVHPEAAAFFERAGWEAAASDYLELIKKAKADSRGVPIIASVNCAGVSRWTSFSKMIEDAGADALELNISFMPVSVSTSGARMESLALSVVREVAEATDLPLAVKLGNAYPNAANLALDMEKAGAKALVLFTRGYSLDIDLEEMKLKAGPIRSEPSDYHESLRWISILHQRTACDLSGANGIHDAETALRFILAGASTVQLCSILYKKGYSAIGEILEGMRAWMERKKIGSLSDIRGNLCQSRSERPEDYLRVQYIQALTGIS